MSEPVAATGLAVSLRQDGPIALDLSFSVGPGKLMALVGPSGSGKTTALRSVAGLYTPAFGRVTCQGRVWLDTEERLNTPTRDRRVGLVFQSYALFPHLTALENVMEALGELPRAARRLEARRLLGRMHLEGFDDRRPAQLSGGQQQRVAVARALARRPDVLLLDEPFSAVDRSARRKLRQELAELRRDLPMPTILVTHDLDDVVRLADDVCVLSGGKILQRGPVAEVMNNPSVAVAELLDLGTAEGPLTCGAIPSLTKSAGSPQGRAAGQNSARRPATSPR